MSLSGSKWEVCVWSGWGPRMPVGSSPERSRRSAGQSWGVRAPEGEDEPLLPRGQHGPPETEAWWTEGGAGMSDQEYE